MVNPIKCDIVTVMSPPKPTTTYDQAARSQDQGSQSRQPVEGHGGAAHTARAFFERQLPIKEIVRTLSVSRATARKVIRGKAIEFRYECGVRPAPKLGEWVEVLTEVLEKEARLPRRERRSTQRLFEELRGRGYDGAHDSVHRFAKAWRNEWARVPVQAFVPLSFAPGEAYQFDWGRPARCAREGLVCTNIMSRPTAAQPAGDAPDIGKWQSGEFGVDRHIIKHDANTLAGRIFLGAVVRHLGERLGGGDTDRPGMPVHCITRALYRHTGCSCSNACQARVRRCARARGAAGITTKPAKG
jgi:hypothetical protein